MKTVPFLLQQLLLFLLFMRHVNVEFEDLADPLEFKMLAERLIFGHVENVILLSTCSLNKLALLIKAEKILAD